MNCEETAEMYEFAGRMSRKYHALIVADYDIDTLLFDIYVKPPGTENYTVISAPAEYPDEEVLEEQIKEALEQLRKENLNG